MTPKWGNTSGPDRGNINGPKAPSVGDYLWPSTGMPNAIGFANGYVQSHTFAVRDKRPLISYDYYLAPDVIEEEVAADLEELAELNKVRPYFLLIPVREYSNIKRVKSILSRLGTEFEVVPLDIFLKMAAEQPTFKERHLEK